MIRLILPILAAVIPLMGCSTRPTTEPAAMRGLTTIVRWYNETNVDYQIECPEQSKNFTIPANEMREGGIYETNVPWVGPPSDFSFGHVIRLNAPNTSQPTWFIWQREEADGDKVRAWTEPTIPGPPINGHADVAGRRYLHITNDGVRMEVEPSR